MRFATISFIVASAFTAFAAFGGCASNEVVLPPNDDGGGDAAVVKDGSTLNKDASTPDAAKTCVDKCASNSDCTSSCPASSGGTFCCDQGSGKCYAFTAAQCPADPPPVDDGGVTPPY